MKMITNCLLLISVLWSCQETGPVSFTHLPYDIDPTLVSPSQVLTLRMSRNGDSLGYSKVSHHIGTNKLIIQENAAVMVNEQPFIEEITTVLQQDHRLVTTTMTGEVSGFPIDIRSKWVADSITGYAKFPDHPKVPIIVIDTILQPPYVDRLSSIFFYPPMLSLETGFSQEYRQFNPQDGKVRAIRLAVTGEEQMITRVGKFDTWQVELSGGVAHQILYISKDVPRKIVAIRFKEIDWEYDLIKIE